MPKTTPTPRWTEYMRIADLPDAPTNAKDHDDDLIGISIRRFGLVDTVILDERTGKLIGGHGRRDALQAMKADGEDAPSGVTVDADGEWLVPVQRGWSSRDDADAEAVGIALNRVSEVGGWKDEQLADSIRRLTEAGIDSEVFGFAQFDVDDLLARLAESAPEIEFGESRDGNAFTEPTLGERADLYRNRQVRSMVFDYPLDDYTAIIEQANRARAAFAVESNAELFQAMLAQWATANPE